MSKPLWKDAPDWAQWLAMDGDGDWFWYEAEPHYTPGGMDDYDCRFGLEWFPCTDKSRVEFAGIDSQAETFVRDEEALSTVEQRP